MKVKEEEKKNNKIARFGIHGVHPGTVQNPPTSSGQSSSATKPYKEIRKQYKQKKKNKTYLIKLWNFTLF
jgi:hypothetical protein